MPGLRTMKRFCRDCGWHIIQQQGDVLGIGDVLLACPKCGSTDVGQVPATLAESLDPIERARAAAHDIGRRLGRGGR